MENIILSNGVEMPKVGFGVFQIPQEECEQAVLDAIEVGYRMIDTAQSYFNEEQVGNAIAKTDVPREELFITTKVWIEFYGYEKTLASVEESMRKLQVEYLDLVLLHQPFGDYYGSYRALVELYEAGKIRAIGVSNFYPDRLSDMVAFNEVKPHVNQVEVNPFHQQEAARVNMAKNNVTMQAWAPFAEGKNDLFTNPVLSEIGAKYDKSVAQVVLRWLAQRDIVSLCKSVRKERMAENFNIFDFELSADDMELIATLDSNESLFFNHQTPEAVELFVGFLAARKHD